MHWFSETLIKTNFYLFEVTISNIQCKINIEKFTHQNLSRNFPWPQLTRTGLQNELFNMISFARFWIKFHLHSWFIILEFFLHSASSSSWMCHNHPSSPKFSSLPFDLINLNIFEVRSCGLIFLDCTLCWTLN